MSTPSGRAVGRAVGRGRRPGAPDTRAEILASARELFAARGFGSTSVRAVAADAGVDPALVHHYFGTKDDLFVAALQIPVDPRELLAPVIDQGEDGAAERLLRIFLGVWDDPEHRLPLIGLFRGLLEPTGERLLREGFLPVVLIPVGERLGIERPELRMPLVASQVHRPDPAPLPGGGGADRLDERRSGRCDVRAGDPAVPVRPASRLKNPVDAKPIAWIIHHMMKNAARVSALDITRGGNKVLRGLDFELAAGEVTGLLGPSGCGKTTLMRALVGVQRITGGSVEVLGAPAGSASLRDQIGYVTQQRSVYDDLTVTENLRFFARILGVGDERVADCIRLVALDDHADRVVGRLSGGQGSRVSLAVALLGEPRFLVLDEPTVGLDPVLRVELWETFHRLADAGAAVLVSSHVMDEASRCDRLLMMRDGQLIADDTPPGLLERTGADDIEHAFLKLVHGQEAA